MKVADDSLLSLDIDEGWLIRKEEGEGARIERGEDGEGDTSQFISPNCLVFLSLSILLDWEEMFEEEELEDESKGVE